jgi:hypothetical protein
MRHGDVGRGRMPESRWNTSENPPGTLYILTNAAGAPVDRYANESVELLRDLSISA